MLASLDESGLFLNVAATCAEVRTLGAGRRFVVWVQGCPFHCAGCIAPDWTQDIPARQMTPQQLAEEILAAPGLDGITLSGGEPMMQPAPLAVALALVHAQRDLPVICFTGFLLENLLREPRRTGVEDLLAQVDVLIDGPYVRERDDNHGLRGSNNQRIHYLTQRLAGCDLENQPRRVEIILNRGHALVAGVPPQHFQQTFDRAVQKAQRWMRV